MRLWALVFLLLGACACRRDPFGAEDLNRMEAALVLTPAQRPAWVAFRREAETANGPRAAWRLQLQDAMSGEHFDARRAQTAADTARADAGRLIDAWARLDGTLTPTQRASVRLAFLPE